MGPGDEGAEVARAVGREAPGVVNEPEPTVIETRPIRWVIRGPRGFWASDGAQSAWVPVVDPEDPHGADLFETKEAAQAYLDGMALMDRDGVAVVEQPLRRADVHPPEIEP